MPAAMSDSESTTADPQRSPELERLRLGVQLGEFFSMSDAQLERAAELLMADDHGYMSFSSLHYLEELDRRATNRHAKQVEVYADRLDRFTRELLGLTLVIVLQTAVVVTLEVEAHHAGWGVIAGAVTLGLAGGVIYGARRIKNA